MIESADLASLNGLVALDAVDLRAEVAELADDILIAALDIVDVRDLARALSGQRGDDHGGARAEIVGLHARSGQVVDAFDDGAAAFDADLRAHARQFADVAVTVVPHALGDHARPLGKAEGNGDLWLHIGRKAGIGQRLDVGAAKLARAAHEQRVVLLLDLHTHLLELGGDAVHVLGDDAAHEDLSAAGGDSRHVGARLDLIGDNGIRAAVELVHAENADGVGAGALDVRAHGV